MVASITGGLINFLGCQKVITGISSITSFASSTITKAADFGLYYFASMAFEEKCASATQRFQATCDGIFDSISCFFISATADTACTAEFVATGGMVHTAGDWINLNWFNLLNWIRK